MSDLGYQWLIHEFDLPPHPLPVVSKLGTRLRETWSGDGSVQREYPAHYQPADTVREDVVEELGFLRAYDAARAAVREVVDMPDRRLDLLIRLLHNNGGGYRTRSAVGSRS